jgi:lysophospholipase L1-like esterase
MKKFLFVCVAVIVILAVALYVVYTGTERKAQERPADNPSYFLTEVRPGFSGTVLVCVGDSITHGRVSANYVDILSGRLGGDDVYVVNAGINSELAYNVLVRLDEVIRCDPDYVTLLIGTNDAHGALVPELGKKQVKEMGLPRPPDEGWFKENLTEIARRLKGSTHASVALISIPPIGEDPADPAFLTAGHYAEIIKEIAGAEGVAYLPLFETMADYLAKHPHDAPPYTFRDQQYDMYVGIGRHFLLGASFDDIARSNGFLLETDYLHLDSAGAAMVAGLIEGFVTKGSGGRP